MSAPINPDSKVPVLPPALQLPVSNQADANALLASNINSVNSSSEQLNTLGNTALSQMQQGLVDSVNDDKKSDGVAGRRNLRGLQDKA